MTGNLWFKYFLFSLLLFFFPLDGFTQKRDYLEIQAKIFVEDGILEGTTLNMEINGKETQQFEIDKDAKFVYRLKFNNEYKLTFSKPGLYTRIILISTQVPKVILDVNSDFPPIEFQVNLYKEIEGFDKSFSLRPYGKIYYEKSIDDFKSQPLFDENQFAFQLDEAFEKNREINKEQKSLDKLELQELQEMQKEYDRIVKEADGLFDQTKYDDALAKYQEGARLFPDRPYPQDRIREIQNLLDALRLAEQKKQDLNKLYKEAVARADLKFEDKLYNDALAAYQQAMQYKPDDSHSQGRIEQIKQIIEQQEKAAKFAETLARAEVLFSNKDYVPAREIFREASDILPGDPRSDMRIEEINRILEQIAMQTVSEQNYQKEIQEGDHLFGQQKYTDAVSRYRAALEIKANDALALEKIEKTELAIRQIQDQQKYDAAIAGADKSFRAKEYQLAENGYREALSIKQEEKYPKEQLERITNILAEESAKRLKKLQYDFLVRSGDSLVNLRNYQEARTSFVKAKSLFPQEKYPDQIILRIDNELKELAARESRMKQAEFAYNQAISRADQAFGNKQYDMAKTGYNEALEIKPGEEYPRNRISEIDKILDEQQIAAENERLYAENMKAGQKAFNEERLADAISSFEKALKYKAGDPLALQRIGEIDKILAQRAEIERMAQLEERQRIESEKANREKYNQMIAMADADFELRKYIEARDHYTSAISTIPGEQYPKDKIKEIDKILEELKMQAEVARQQAIRDSANRARMGNYQLLVRQAEQLATGKKYEEAVSKYNEALKVVPENKTDINARIAGLKDQMRILEKQLADYRIVIVKADGLFNSGKYAEARSLYVDAGNIRPEEEYPKSQIRRIQEMIEKKNLEYTAFIEKGDEYFNQQEWQSAKNSYTDALAVIPGDEYAAKQVQLVSQKINLALAADMEKSRVNKAFADVVKQADNMLAAGRLREALNQYKVAKSLKPEDAYPDQKISEVGGLIRIAMEDSLRLAQAKDEDDRYRQIIALADQSFRNKTYDEAVKRYENALQIKPGETYPQKQIGLIRQMVQKTEPVVAEAPKNVPVQAENKPEQVKRGGAEEYLETSSRDRENLTITETNRLYDETIARADGLFAKKDYSVARFHYYKASDIKPSEAYPRQRIEEIGRLIDIGLSSGTIIAYEGAIKQGDEAFSKKNYTVAKFYYYKALEIKSWERYPKDRIHELQVLTNTLLSEREQKLYNEAIALADEAYYAKNYSVSRFHYNEAARINPEERYPKIKIEDIRKLLEQEKRDQVRIEYMNQLRQADQAFEDGDYSVARFYYNKALSIQKNEQYPKDQLKRIEEALLKRTK
ncbi:MAG: hypothetical protein RBS73_10925 [Prolixibacteraceae bacterium]|jgi:tetratricopeptide (TPR) repeat protein|nr:hypothetical protein [Prolixibacteraceae bacterium]